MKRSLAAAGHHVHDVHLSGNARAQFGDQHFAGDLIVDSKPVPLTDFTGTYAYNALCPVSVYVDRPDLHRQIEEQLRPQVDSPCSKTLVVFVQGIGGVGKTQLALNYVQRRRQDYSAVFWLDASSLENLERDYIQLYILLYNVQPQVAQNSVQASLAVPAVKRWFQSRAKKWLFVFDNADSISNSSDPSYIDLRHFLPDEPCVQVIVTTRDWSATQVTELPAVQVDKMSSQEAALLFQRQIKMQTLTVQQEQEIHDITSELGYLALAVSIAGSYVAATPRLRRNLDQYLSEYRDRRTELLAQRPTWLVHQYGESVLTTWETTFRTIKMQSPASCKFLALLSSLNSDDIPPNFPIASTEDGTISWLSLTFPGEQIAQHDIDGFFRILSAYSFVRYQEDTDSYSMHKLVQVWSFDRLDQEQQLRCVHAGALLLQTMMNTTAEEDYVEERRIRIHMLSGLLKMKEAYQSTPYNCEYLYIAGIYINFLRARGECQRKLLTGWTQSTKKG